MRKIRNTVCAPVGQDGQGAICFGPPMANIEARAAKTIQLHYRGHGQAVSVRGLSLILGTSERATRGIIQGLINVHGLPIGSSVNPPAGYYWITDPEELEATCRSLRHRGIAILVRAAKLKKASLEAVFGQARMEYENGGPLNGRMEQNARQLDTQ